MATLQYHLVQRTSHLGKNAGKPVYTAQPIINRRLSFSDLCRQLADGSTVSTADVKAVLDRLSLVIVRNLELGMSVDCGDLGTFRPSFGSKGVESEDEFNVELISKPRVVFTPRKDFKNSLHHVGFEKGTPPLKKLKLKKGTPPASGGSNTIGSADTSGRAGF